VVRRGFAVPSRACGLKLKLTSNFSKSRAGGMIGVSRMENPVDHSRRGRLPLYRWVKGTAGDETARRR